MFKKTAQLARDGFPYETMLDYEEDADNNHIRMQPFGQFCQNALSCNANAALLQSVICIHNCTLPSHHYSNLVPGLSDQGLPQ